jgi:hypothetical protein
MGKINDSVRTFNSVVRTFLFAVLLAAAGLGGWKGYSLYYEPQKKLSEQQRELETVRGRLVQADQDLSSLSAELEEKNAQLDRLETSLRLLKLRHRVAHLRVVDLVAQDDSNGVVSTIDFYEVNDEGMPVSDDRKIFEIEGNRVYVECLVAKFEDKYIEQADLDRSTAICLFQRIFGEFQQPQDGFPVENIGSIPTSYARGGKMSEFEQQIWSDFWTIANDRQKAAELGIRAAHADAPSTQVQKGATYELELRSTGEFTLRRLEQTPAAASEDSEPSA